MFSVRQSSLNGSRGKNSVWFPPVGEQTPGLSWALVRRGCWGHEGPILLAVIDALD